MHVVGRAVVDARGDAEGNVVGQRYSHAAIGQLLPIVIVAATIRLIMRTRSLRKAARRKASDWMSSLPKRKLTGLAREKTCESAPATRPPTERDVAVLASRRERAI